MVTDASCFACGGSSLVCQWVRYKHVKPAHIILMHDRRYLDPTCDYLSNYNDRQWLMTHEETKLISTWEIRSNLSAKAAPCELLRWAWLTSSNLSTFSCILWICVDCVQIRLQSCDLSPMKFSKNRNTPTQNNISKQLLVEKTKFLV